jgi:hypothetical protein
VDKGEIVKSNMEDIEKRLAKVEASLAQFESYDKLLQSLAEDFKRFYFSLWAEELRRQRPFIDEAQMKAVGDRIRHMVDEKFESMVHDNAHLHQLHIVLFNTLHTSLMHYIDSRLEK